MPDDELSQSNTQPTPEELDISEETDVNQKEDKDFSKKSKRFRVALGIVSLLLILAAIPTAAYLVRQRQELRKRAAMTKPCRICQYGYCNTVEVSPNCDPTLDECSSNTDCAASTPTPTPTSTYTPTRIPSTPTPTPIHPTPTPTPRSSTPTPTPTPASPDQECTTECQKDYGSSVTGECRLQSDCSSGKYSSIGDLYCSPGGQRCCCISKPTITPTPTPTPTPISCSSNCQTKKFSYATCYFGNADGCTSLGGDPQYLVPNPCPTSTITSTICCCSNSLIGGPTPTPTPKPTPTLTPTPANTKTACTTQCQQNGRTNAWGECRNASNCPADYYTSTSETYCSPSSLACCCIIPTSTPTPTPGGQTPDQVCTALCTVEHGDGTKGGCTSPLNLRGWDLVHGGDSTDPMINPCVNNGLLNQCRCNPATYPGGATPTPTPTGGVVIVVGPTTTPTPTPTPALASLNFSLKFQGIDPNRTDVLTETIRVILKQGDQVKYQFDNVVVTSGTGMAFAGRVENITSGTYDIYIKGWAHLQKKFANVTLNQGANSQDFTSTVLKAGDTDNNNKIDIYDYNKVVEDFGKTVLYRSIADFNLSGRVDIFDYNLVVENFNQTGD